MNNPSPASSESGTDPRPAAAALPAEGSLPLRRAEEMVDHLGMTMGHYGTIVGGQVVRWLARAREEAEDILAEAQSIRHSERLP